MNFWDVEPSEFPDDGPRRGRRQPQRVYTNGHDPDGETLPPLTATPFDAARALSHPPRAWVYSHFLIRRFLSVLGAPGGIGKTAYAMTVGVAVALDLALLGEAVHEPGAVWVYNLEDPQDELDRRVLAIAHQHEIEPARLQSCLYVDNGRDKPLIVARRLETGEIIATPLVDELIAELKRRDIRLLIVDPFVKSHRLEENRNEQIDFAAQQWSRVAEEADCAILLVHHFRKGLGANGDADAFRGASALIDAARAAVSLAIMTEAEASQFGIGQADRKLYLRLDNAKLNLARPPAEAMWLRLCDVELHNGDHIQAVTRWHPPSTFEGVSMASVVRIMDRLHAGPGDGEQYTMRPTSSDKSRWAGTVAVEEADMTEAQATAALLAWAATKLIEATRYRSPKQRRERGGLCVNQTKLTEMRQQCAARQTADE